MSNYLTDEELDAIACETLGILDPSGPDRELMRAAIAAYVAKGEPVAWLVELETGVMLFDQHEEALAYIDEDNPPIPLFVAPQPTPQERQDAARLDVEAERDAFERDATPMGFDMERQDLPAPEPWSEYVDEETGHRWGGWLARAAMTKEKP